MSDLPISLDQLGLNTQWVMIFNEWDRREQIQGDEERQGDEDGQGDEEGQGGDLHNSYVLLKVMQGGADRDFSLCKVLSPSGQVVVRKAIGLAPNDPSPEGNILKMLHDEVEGVELLDLRVPGLLRNCTYPYSPSKATWYVEHYNLGDLYKLWAEITRKFVKKGQFPMVFAVRCLKHMVEALLAILVLPREGVDHGDVCLPNVFVNHPPAEMRGEGWPDFILGDFGSAKSAGEVDTDVRHAAARQNVEDMARSFFIAFELDMPVVVHQCDDWKRVRKAVNDLVEYLKGPRGPFVQMKARFNTAIEELQKAEGMHRSEEKEFLETKLGPFLRRRARDAAALDGTTPRVFQSEEAVREFAYENGIVEFGWAPFVDGQAVLSGPMVGWEEDEGDNGDDDYVPR